MQAVLDCTPIQAGVAIAPMLIGFPLASAIASRALRRAGAPALVRIGKLIAMTAALALAVTLGPGASIPIISALAFLLSFGIGTTHISLLITVQHAVPWNQRGIVTASTMFFRMIGGALAVGILGAAVAHGLEGRAPPSVVGQLLSPAHRGAIDHTLLVPLKAALASSLDRLLGPRGYRDRRRDRGFTFQEDSESPP